MPSAWRRARFACRSRLVRGHRRLTVPFLGARRSRRFEAKAGSASTLRLKQGQALVCKILT
jgi:hypothetical protein